MAGLASYQETMASITKTGGGSKVQPSKKIRERAIKDRPVRPLAEDHLLYLLFELERVVTRSTIAWSPGLASGIESRLQGLIQTVRRNDKR
jgi:hypothetical protein